MLLKNKHFFFVIAIAAMIALTLYACEDSTSIEDTPRPAEGQAPAAVQSELQSQQQGELIERQYLVIFKERWQEVRTSEVAEQVRAFTNQFMDDTGIPADSVIARFEFVLRGFTARIDADKAEALQGDSRVNYVQQDRRFKAISFVADKEPKLEASAESSASQTIPWGITRVEGPLDGTGETAWVLDTGIDLDHPDLNVDTDNSASFIAGESADDLNGHGTHVAGILAAIDNDRDVVGMAAGATVVSVKVLDQNGFATSTSICNGIDHVTAQGTTNHVVNLSISVDPDASIDQAVIDAADMGFRFAIAAGNDGVHSDSSSPGRVEHANVWTMSAYDDNDTFWSSSNFGNPPIEYGGPGVDIPSLAIGGGVTNMSGTSMASPHIAGLLLASVAGIDADGTVSNDPDGDPDPIGVKADSDVSVFIDGPTFVTNGQEGEWTAEVSGGFPPYSYKWFRSNTDPTWWQQVGTGSSYSETVTESFDLKVEVTDESNTTVSDVHSVSTD